MFVRPYRRQVAYRGDRAGRRRRGGARGRAGPKGVVDRGFGAGNAGELDRTLALMLGVIVVMAAATFTRFYFVSWIGERVTADLRRAVFDHLLDAAAGFLRG